MTLDVAGRTAFITGGANGIGLGIARALARASARVALVDLDVKALETAEIELGRITEVMTIPLDVRDRAAFAQAADAVEARLGPVSLLFNNAGVAGGAPAARLTYELWDWGLGINLDGVINGVQTFLPRMAARGGGGHIVNTSSGAGLAAAGGAGLLYQTAKYAVVGLSEALALELADAGIGVSVLCPGPVATDIITRTRGMQPSVTRSMSKSQLDKARAESAAMKDQLSQGVSPDDVGALVLEAVRSNHLYVHTDRLMAPYVAARTRALLDAMPAEMDGVAA
jgi:NAD(P)-dependent dehydrogenase (short-subunit alcohol dehydrogenase family)